MSVKQTNEEEGENTENKLLIITLAPPPPTLPAFHVESTFHALSLRFYSMPVLLHLDHYYIMLDFWLNHPSLSNSLWTRTTHTFQPNISLGQQFLFVFIAVI